MKHWRRTSSGGNNAAVAPANVTSVVAQGDGTVYWVFDSPLDAAPSPWTNLDGFTVNGETTLSALKIDAFTINMAYTTFVNAGDAYVLNAAPPTNVIFDPARQLQSSSGGVT